ncbi:bifunctional acetate--CoA ligase family protein/GNAT family N-acetyltransferase [Desulfovibrio inopinatus]|uniref:bifunctional acetate--CoA ligase family protein/GNAT family N-acetyltransferase n=1 Tax=Desulfovibrio inopinatus TaxID=102109 RepID=UPI000414B679|nr:bifunctional acetate--CoA ligase family protein/GNAT family N-acetyltransferase [Desulfovibrio inopinatus]
MSLSSLDAMFKPNSVTVIGASNESGSVGNIVMRNLLGGKFLGPVMPISPGQDSVMGILSYKDVDTLPLTPDLGIICSEPNLIPDYIRGLGRRGVRSAVVLPPGWQKLLKKEKWALHQKMLDMARHYEMRLLGPSGLGLIVPGVGLNASLSATDALPGKIAFVSQSASLFTAVVDWARSSGIGFSHIISLGEGIDLEYGDLLDYLAADVNVRSILLYVDTVSNARDFISASRAAARNKPVLVIKPGRKLWCADCIAASSEKSLDEVYDEAFRRAGILRVFEIDSLFDAARTLVRAQPLLGDKLAILTNGGSIGVMAADSLLGGGGNLADFSEDTQKALSSLLGPNWCREGIVDMSFNASGDTYVDALKVIIKDKDVSAVLVMHVPFAGVSGEDVAEAVSKVLKKTKRTGLTCWLGFDIAEGAREIFAKHGIPTYETPDKAVGAFLYMMHHRRNQELLMEMPSSLPTDFLPNTEKAKAVIDAALDENRYELSADEAQIVLGAYGIPIVETRLAKSPDEARDAAVDLGGPVALKIVSPDIPQPFEVGGITLDIEDPATVDDIARSMISRVTKLRPDAGITGFLVQKMGRKPAARELLIRASVDPIFGPYVIFGQGGLAAAINRDKAVALPPLNMTLARDLIYRTRVSLFLAGRQDEPEADMDSISRAVIMVSQLISDIAQVTDVDINPILADHQGVTVLNARIKIARVDVEPQNRLAIRPYPRELEECAVLSNGQQVLLRPIKPEDEPAHYDFFTYLEPEDLRFRFFGIVRELSHREMARLTQIDYEREMAFIASATRDDGTPETLGVVRASLKPDINWAEFAIIIRSDQKGQRLGSILMDKMIRFLKDRGIATVTGQALVDNKGMQGLARKFGFKIIKDIDEDVVDMRLSLTDMETQHSLSG